MKLNQYRYSFHEDSICNYHLHFCTDRFIRLTVAIIDYIYTKITEVITFKLK